MWMKKLWTRFGDCETLENRFEIHARKGVEQGRGVSKFFSGFFFRFPVFSIVP